MIRFSSHNPPIPLGRAPDCQRRWVQARSTAPGVHPAPQEQPLAKDVPVLILPGFLSGADLYEDMAQELLNKASGHALLFRASPVPDGRLASCSLGHPPMLVGQPFPCRAILRSKSFR